MATTTTLVYSQSTIVSAGAISPAAAPTTRGTLDLTAKFGAWLFLRLGFKGTTNWDYPITIQVRPVLASGAIHPGSAANRNATIIAATASSTVSVDAAANATSITVTSATGFLAQDTIMIQDGGGGFTRLEFARISKVSGSVLYLDAPLRYAHTAAQADVITNGSQMFPKIRLDGGTTWEVIFDGGKATSGSDVVVEAIAVTCMNESTV